MTSNFNNIAVRIIFCEIGVIFFGIDFLERIFLVWGSLYEFVWGDIQYKVKTNITVFSGK